MSKHKKDKKNEEKVKAVLSKQDVEHLAHLIRLEIDEDQLKQISEQLADTIDYVENMGELDLSKVSETTHSTDAKNVTFDDGTPSDRTFSQADATANAAKSADGYFIVDKMLDK